MILQLSNVPLRGVRILQLGPYVIQTASITGRATRGKPLCLPSPFPYETKKFTVLDRMLDPTIVKISQENCKLISVEGPIGVGKSAFCKTLAEQFDMLYIPQPTLEPFYILPSGYDLRNHDDELPEIVRPYDYKNFCVDPKNRKAGLYQMKMLYLRFHQYMDALCHMLNTGQGVILERNYFSDYVFAKAMCENNFISKAVLDTYNEVFKNTSIFYPRPHLIIYLDIPVPVVQERIRTRNYSHEQNSPALTNEYLKSLEEYWKKDYLRNAKKFSEVLIYDWSDGGDVNVVIDDIEKIDFDIMRRDKKFVQWWLSRSELFYMRRLSTNYKFYYDKFFYYPVYEVDDLYIPEEDRLKFQEILSKIPESKYDIGYNYLAGDSIFNILFKINVENHRAFRFHVAQTTLPH